MCDGAANQFRDNSVEGPIAAPDHVAGSRARNGDAVLRELVGGKKRLAIRSDHDLGRTLARAIGIEAAERVALAVAPGLLAIFVALVGRHSDDGARSIERS